MFQRKTPFEAEWEKLQKKEQKFLKAHEEQKESFLNQKLAEKVPAKLQETLDKAFAKAFGIQFTDKDNTLKYVHQTSWGMTTRLIGAIIMVHGDNEGLVMPPKVAPVQVCIIPIQQKKEGVLDKAYELKDRLKGFRVKVDDTDKSPGWKFSEQEMRGIPVRIEIGPRDIENNQCVAVMRSTGEKITLNLDELHLWEVGNGRL